jgi:hypothetical protein
MHATAVITFTDGTTKELPLGEKCLELDLHNGHRQSIAINQKADGTYKMSFTTGLMQGTSWESITIKKEPTQ